MTVYYVKNGGNDSANGLSDANAWATLSKVRNFTGYGSSDHVLLKCGDVWTNQWVSVNWAGVSGNPAVLGAYHGSEIRGVSGTKPIIDGNNNTGLISEYRGLITLWGGDFVTVENLISRNGEGIGIRSNYPDSVITGCEVYTHYKSGILVENGHRALLDGNTVYDCGRTWPENSYNPPTGKPGIVVFLKSDDCIARNNLIYNCWGEGIIAGAEGGGGTDPSYATESGKTIIEDNKLFGMRQIGIYVSMCRNTIVRRNLIVGSADSSYWRDPDGSGAAIFINDETTNRSGGPWLSQNNRIYNNMVAACKVGIQVSTAQTFLGEPTNSNFKDSYVIGNTVVDCTVLWKFINNVAENSFIRNNIAASYDPSTTVFEGPSTLPGITFSNNNFPGASPAAMAGSGDVAGNPVLMKNSGWRNIFSHDSFSADDFKILTGSPCIDAGILLPAPFDVDYFGTSRA